MPAGRHAGTDILVRLSRQSVPLPGHSNILLMYCAQAHLLEALDWRAAKTLACGMNNLMLVSIVRNAIRHLASLEEASAKLDDRHADYSSGLLRSSL